MFIERIANTGYSSVGAASARGRCRSYGASELLSDISINIRLLRSERSCLDANDARSWHLRQSRFVRFRNLIRRALGSCAFALVLTGIAAAQQYGPMKSRGVPEKGIPPTLRQAVIEQRLNEQLPLDVTLKDESGRAVRLGQFFGARPVALAFVYYECPMLCNQVMRGLVGSLKAVKFDAGRDFEVVALSIDPRENLRPGLAAQKREAALAHYGRAGTEQGWHLLTGDEQAIRRVTDAAGFKFYWDPVMGQFAHASGVMIATPDGRLSRYFYGIEYAPRDVKLGLIEAAGGKIGSPVDALLLYCYNYDVASGKYTAVVRNVLKLAAVGFLALAGAGFLALRQWKPRRVRSAEEAPKTAWR